VGNALRAGGFEGEARLKRRQEIIKEISGWKHRLETAATRIAELTERKRYYRTAIKDALDRLPPMSSCA